MKTLVFQLYAPLASWGETAVGEYRPSAAYPSFSALQGLLGAALGIKREDEAAHTTLRETYRFAIGVLNPGRLLRDYHTAQVPGRTDLKKRPHATRRDELALPKQDLNTILSSRDYRQDAACLIAVQSADEAKLNALMQALKAPCFTLYLGRKSCPPAEPLYPQLFEVETVKLAFDAYQTQLKQAWQNLAQQPKSPGLQPLTKMVWGDEFNGEEIGVTSTLCTTRKDRVIARTGWLFADRNEHIALLAKE